ncbi:hypothetical protein ACM40_14755 [Chryseobacterium sp. BLS98]|uniref:hypothetical protein n=1 Tax=Chryseobacterium sp. BLS98 TaxID=885586 RepID=UPI00065ACA83|nr:hypothetical protein [Chryseobacterium sp. BLS98]KMQ60968.1 hypothetical protein ACM40_14755 [Chryseobacterium sp. BLS98]
MKRISLILILFSISISCNKENTSGFETSEASINSLLENFPMINKNLEKIKKIDLDSLSITLYENPEKEDYDEILVFEKNKRFYSIPFFSNMYFDYWNFTNTNTPQLHPKTNTTFEKQMNILVKELRLNPKEFQILTKALMNNVLNTETNLYLKPKIFENYVYLTYRVNKYKMEESDSCINRTKNIFNYILKESKKTSRYNEFFLDSENGRVYEFINNSKKRSQLKFKIKTYRIDCFSYPLNI